MKFLLAAIVLLVVVLLPILILVERGDWTSHNIAESQQRGDDILQALRRYYGDHGAYPAALNMLVPKYLPAVPPPTAGTFRWEYRLVGSDEQRFYLDFTDRKGRERYFRTGASKTWEYDDGNM